MTKWEYYVMFIPHQIIDAQLELNYHGRDGWELVSIDNERHTVYFKRPLEEKQKDMADGEGYGTTR